MLKEFASFDDVGDILMSYLIDAAHYLSNKGK